MHASTRQRAGLPIAVTVVALLVGCSSTAAPRVATLGSTGTTTTAVAPSGSPASAGSPLVNLDKYAACMRAHGVADFPDPVVHQSGGDQAVKVVVPAPVGKSRAFVAAANACKSLAPPPPTPQTITPQQQQDYLNAATCMRSHGITGFPDPVFADGGVKFPIPSGMDTNSPQFLQARQTCEKLIPAGLPYSN